MMKLSERGRVEYTARAFRQDAEDAMGGNIIRGLVELITNADDAYTNTDDADTHAKVKLGRIRVEIEHRRGKSWRVVVRDRARGMTRHDLFERIVKLGQRTSGFETGKAVRGNRGRGAKDLAAFGTVTFESIREDRYARLILEQSGEYELPRDTGASEVTRKRLGIPRGNGTVVTVEVSPNIRCPHHDTLRGKLIRDYRLRFVTTDPERDLTLVNANKPSETDPLRWEVDESALELLFDDNILIDGYPDALAHLTVRRLAERSDYRPSDPERLSGILVRGRRAVYDNTLFAFEGDPFAARFAGYLDCPFIDDLANKYDDSLEERSIPDDSNPMEIINRRRDGLAQEHPFVSAMAQACEVILKGLVRQEETREREKAQAAANEETHRTLSRMAREAARFLQESLREIDEEEPPVLRDLGTRPLQIVPPTIALTIGEDRVVSILAAEQAMNGETDVTITTDPGGVLELLNGSIVQLRPHRTREGVLSAQLKLRPLLEGETLLACTVGNRQEVAVVSVGAADQNRQGRDEEAPETLEFERPRYTVRWNKPKSLHVRAPDELVREAGKRVRVKSDHAGVVIRGDIVELSQDPTGTWWEGIVQIEGRELGCKGTITATLNGMTAHCRIAVEEKDEMLPNLRIELAPEGEGFIYRAIFYPSDPKPNEQLILKIMTKHEGIRAILGDNWERQDTPEWKALSVEIVTDAIVRRLMERKYPKGTEVPTAQGFYFDLYTYSTRLLPILQKGLVVDSPAVSPVIDGELANGLRDASRPVSSIHEMAL